MERGNFIWKGEEIVWEPSKNGRFRLDNFFGVCPYDAPIIIASNSLKRAVAYGSILGSFCVEKIGPGKYREMNFSDIENRYRKLKEYTTF